MRSIILLSMILLSTSTLAATETFHAAARGFGDVRVELRTYGEGHKQSSWTTFRAEDAAHARISGLVKKDGENVLRWVPGNPRSPEITRKQTRVIPDLNLVWTEER